MDSPWSRKRIRHDLATKRQKLHWGGRKEILAQRLSKRGKGSLHYPQWLHSPEACYVNNEFFSCIWMICLPSSKYTVMLPTYGTQLALLCPLSSNRITLFFAKLITGFLCKTFQGHCCQRAIKDETCIWGCLAGGTWSWITHDHLTSMWEESVTELES